MKIKTFLLIIFLLSGSTFVLADPPEVPHRAYGEVTDSGQTVSDVEVAFFHEDEMRGSADTNSDGFYDVKVNGSEGEQITVFVENEETSYEFEFVTGSSMRLDIEANVDDHDDETEDDSETDSGSGGTTGGGGSTDSSSDPSLGGGDLDDSGDEEETETEEEIFTLSEVEDSLTVDSLTQETEVTINKESESSGFTGFSFTTGSDIENLEIQLRNMEDSPVEPVEIDSVYNYGEFSSNYELTGNLGLKADKSVLNSENKDSSDLLVYYYDGSEWVSLDYDVVGEDIENVYLDVSGAEQGYYALGSRAVQGFQGIQNVNFEMNKIENGLNVSVEGELRNERNNIFTETIEFFVDDERIETRALEAESGQTQDFSFNYLIEDEGVYEVRVNDFSEQVTFESESIVSMFLLAALTGVLGLVTVIGYLYVQSSRNVQKVDRRIEHIRRQQESMNKRMKDVRENLSNVSADLDKE